jgi:hypothetical protein
MSNATEVLRQNQNNHPMGSIDKFPKKTATRVIDYTFNPSILQVARPSNMLPSNASKSSGSTVFDRLYSNSTESSRVRKSVAPVTKTNILTRQDDKNHKTRITPSSSSLQTKSHSNIMQSKNNRSGGPVLANSSTCSGGVHDRLYSKGTASYNSKRKTSTVPTGGASSTKMQSRGPLKTKTNA